MSSSTACGETVDIDSSLSACFIAANSSQQVRQIFSTCCAQVHSTTATSSDGCFISCSATDGTLATCFGNGLLSDSINPLLVDDACYGAAAGGVSTTGGSSPVSGSATTSSTPAATASTTAATTAASTTAASSGTSTTGSASGSASPSASKTAKAARGVSLSYGAMAILGLAVCGLLA
jgi:hypothetical protein